MEAALERFALRMSVRMQTGVFLFTFFSNFLIIPHILLVAGREQWRIRSNGRGRLCSGRFNEVVKGRAVSTA